MKAKITRGKGFAGAARYLLNKDHAEVVGGTMAGQDAESLSAEFAETRQQRPDIERPVWHHSLSLPQGEWLSDEQWHRVASDYMERMAQDEGIDPQAMQWQAVRHEDTDHDHIHILASRITRDGDLAYGQNEAKRAINITQDLERDHDLTRTPGLDAGRGQRQGAEVERAARTGEAGGRQKLQGVIDTALADRPSTEAFCERLEAAGVSVRFNQQRTGRVAGVSFEMDGQAFKASQLGKAYGWGQLQKRGLDYEQERDGAAIGRRADGSAAGRGEDRGGASARPHHPDRPTDRAGGAAGREHGDADRGNAQGGGRGGAEPERGPGRPGQRGGEAARGSEPRGPDRGGPAPARSPGAGAGVAPDAVAGADRSRSAPGHAGRVAAARSAIHDASDRAVKPLSAYRAALERKKEQQRQEAERKKAEQSQRQQRRAEGKQQTKEQGRTPTKEPGQKPAKKQPTKQRQTTRGRDRGRGGPDLSR